MKLKLFSSCPRKKNRRFGIYFLWKAWTVDSHRIRASIAVRSFQPSYTRACYHHSFRIYFPKIVYRWRTKNTLNIDSAKFFTSNNLWYNPINYCQRKGERKKNMSFHIGGFSITQTNIEINLNGTNWQEKLLIKVYSLTPSNSDQCIFRKALRLFGCVWRNE